MKTVKFYHLVGVFSLLLMSIITTLGGGDSRTIIIIGFGVVIVLLLGIHLSLGKQERDIERIEKRISELSDEIDVVKLSENFSSNMGMQSQAAIITSLKEINTAINDIKGNKV